MMLPQWGSRASSQGISQRGSDSKEGLLPDVGSTFSEHISAIFQLLEDVGPITWEGPQDVFQVASLNGKSFGVGDPPFRTSAIQPYKESVVQFWLSIHGSPCTTRDAKYIHGHLGKANLDPSLVREAREPIQDQRRGCDCLVHYSPKKSLVSEVLLAKEGQATIHPLCTGCSGDWTCWEERPVHLV